MINYKKMFAFKGGPYSNPKPLPKPNIPKKIQRGKYSYYLLPLTKESKGNSRICGDASDKVQKEAIDALISKSSKHGLDRRQTAHVLAIAYLESGFNPDAAAGTTSASGLGQFVLETGESYGLTYSVFNINATHFEILSNADALVRHYLDNQKLAIKRGNRGKQLEERIYQYHHDGPGRSDRNSGEGLCLSKSKVLPMADNIEKLLSGTFTGIHVDPARNYKRRTLPKNKTNKKYIHPAAAGKLHPHAAETSVWFHRGHYNTKYWNIAPRLHPVHRLSFGDNHFSFGIADEFRLERQRRLLEAEFMLMELEMEVE